MSLVVAGIGPHAATRGRLSASELVRHGRDYLSKLRLPAGDDVALEVGYTLALVGPSRSLRQSLAARLTPAPEPVPLPDPDPVPVRDKRGWGKGKTARLELRLSPRERAEFAAMAKTRGESVAEYVREAAQQHLAYDVVLQKEKQQELRGRRHVPYRVAVALDAIYGDAEPAERLRACATLRSETDAMERRFAVDARAHGVTWPAIGAALGVTKRTAEQRYGPIDLGTPGFGRRKPRGLRTRLPLIFRTRN